MRQRVVAIQLDWLLRAEDHAGDGGVLAFGAVENRPALVALTENISESQFRYATLKSRIAR